MAICNTPNDSKLHKNSGYIIEGHKDMPVITDDDKPAIESLIKRF